MTQGLGGPVPESKGICLSDKKPNTIDEILSYCHVRDCTHQQTAAMLRELMDNYSRESFEKGYQSALITLAKAFPGSKLSETPNPQHNTQ